MLSVLCTYGLIDTQARASLMRELEPDEAGAAAESLGVEATIAAYDPEATEQVAPYRASWRYETLRNLGKGGMGTVDLARDQLLQREVAVKLCLSRDAGAIARFVREAQIGARLDHPHIAPVYDAGTHPETGAAFLSMKFVEGTPLNELLRALRKQDHPEREWPLKRRLTLLCRVLEGVAYAHARGVIHRDLKPANIIVGDFGQVFVVDWGLAKVIGEADASREAEAPGSARAQGDSTAPDVTLAGSVLGTPGYLSPEQATGRLDNVSERSDIFSIGVILYELLALDRAFPGRDAQRVLESVAAVRCKPLRRLAPEVPPACAAVVARAMERLPHRRYESAIAMLDDVQALVDDRLPSVYEATWLERAGRQLRQRATTLALVALALVVVAGVFAVLGRSARLQADAEHQRAAAAQVAAEAAHKAADAERARAKAADAGAEQARLQQARAERRVRAQAPYMVARNLLAHRVTASRLRESVTLLREALTIAPDFHEARIELIRTLVVLDQGDRLPLEVTQLIENMPADERGGLRYLLQAGMAAVMTGKAPKLSAEILAMRPSILSAGYWHGLLAAFCCWTKAYPEAEKQIRIMLASPGGDIWESWFIWARLLKEQERYAEAVALLDRQIERYRGVHPLQVERASCLRLLDKLEASRKACEAVLREDPDDDQARDALATAWTRWMEVGQKTGSRSTSIIGAIASLRYHSVASERGPRSAVRSAARRAPNVVHTVPGFYGKPARELLNPDWWRAATMLATTLAQLEREQAKPPSDDPALLQRRVCAQLGLLLAWLVELPSRGPKARSALGLQETDRAAIQAIAREFSPLAIRWLKAHRDEARPFVKPEIDAALAALSR